mmetsp:Transcript_317/g.447  ORF Transcript_317/g.447 Transcript_317/m.447 type:complete len:300 (+) Transcript_317:121-1020(+)
MSLFLLLLLLLLLICQLSYRWHLSMKNNQKCSKISLKIGRQAHQNKITFKPDLPQLSAVLLFRLFHGDSLRFTVNDLHHWLDYMRFAGIDHFYLYDNCHSDEECIPDLGRLPDATYIKWQIKDYKEAQTPAYNHHLQAHHPQASYEIILDMDEYPFIPSNTKTNFLKHYALQNGKRQVLLRTVFFGGPPSSSERWRVLRYFLRRPKAEEEGRTKPLYQPPEVNFRDGIHNLHQMLLYPTNEIIDEEPFKYSPYDIMMGYDKTEDESILRLNHYWCERLQNDSMLQYDNSISAIVEQIKK